MFKIERTSQITVSKDLVMIVVFVLLFAVVYFFSFQIQVMLSRLLKWFGQKVGTYSVTREYALQRYVYQHRGSRLSRLYLWINEQILALGLKRQGVTPFGYFMFWGFVAIVSGTIIGISVGLGVVITVFLWVAILACLLIVTRVWVSERMERREADVMNAIDLIVPELANGVKNAILIYKDNFAPSLRDDFVAFIYNIQDRGYSFNDAMCILADNLGLVFVEFSQKAMYYEASGDQEMLDIFVELTETNRLRRELRDENSAKFTDLKVNFIVTVSATAGYFVFLMITDSFSRYFFLQATIGKVLLIFIVLVIFLVLSYISTIKSRAI